MDVVTSHCTTDTMNGRVLFQNAHLTASAKPCVSARTALNIASEKNRTSQDKKRRLSLLSALHFLAMKCLREASRRWSST